MSVERCVACGQVDDLDNIAPMEGVGLVCKKCIKKRFELEEGFRDPTMESLEVRQLIICDLLLAMYKELCFTNNAFIARSDEGAIDRAARAARLTGENEDILNFEERIKKLKG